MHVSFWRKVFLLAFFQLLLAASLFAQAMPQSAPRSAPEPQIPPVLPPVVGRWDAFLIAEAPGGTGYEVPFTLLVEPRGRELQASILNGTDRMSFDHVSWDNTVITMTLAQYEGTLSARCEEKKCDHLNGEYRRVTSKGEVRFKVNARRHPIEVITEPYAWEAPTLSGEWTFNIDYPDPSPDRAAPAIFEQRSARYSPDKEFVEAQVLGTVAPVSGDYGLMNGTIFGEAKAPNTPKVVMSRFDGIHILRLEGQFAPDGTLTGILRFSPTSARNFVATRRTPAPSPTGTPAEPDPESVTKITNPQEPFRFTAVDLRTGKQVTEAQFRGKPLIVDIFGTWCPNCHDEAPLLADLYNRYHKQGLQIVGLAYEYTDDRKRSARLIDVYRKRYNIAFPLLFAGTTADGQIEKTLPQLVNFGAYPTTIFIDGTGRVRAIHAGFAGPSTGKFAAVKQRFEELVKEITKGAPAAGK